MSSDLGNVSLVDASQIQSSNAGDCTSVNEINESFQRSTLNDSPKADTTITSSSNLSNSDDLTSKYVEVSSEELISMIRGSLNESIRVAQGFNSVVVNYFFSRDDNAYKRLVTSTYFKDILLKISAPLKVLQSRMEDGENTPVGSLTAEETKSAKEYIKVFDQVSAHVGFLECMRESLCFEIKDDFESLIKYSDWICSLSFAYTNVMSTSQSELLHKELQTYLRDVYDSFLNEETIDFEKTITSKFRTLINWNITTSDKMTSFPKMEFVFNFSQSEIEGILIAAFNSGTLGVLMEEFLETFSYFVDQCMKYSFIDSYSFTECLPPVVSLPEDGNSTKGTKVRRKFVMRFADGFPVEYQTKLKNFISKTREEEIPVIKLNCLIDFLERFNNDLYEIFELAFCEVADQGKFTLLDYMGEHGLSSKIIERIRVSVDDYINLAFDNADEVAKLIERIDSVMVPYVKLGLIRDSNFISSMDSDIKDRLTNKICGEIMSWVKKSCTNDFLTVTIVGVPESAILHSASSYKDDTLWKVDRSNIKTIVNEGKDELLPLKSRLVQCQITVSGKKLTDYMIKLLDMHNESDVYNTITVEKTFNAFLETYVNIIENDYRDRLTKEFGLAVSFFNSCYYLTKRIGVYLSYSFSKDTFYNFAMIHSKLRDLACSSLGFHLTRFKGDLSNKLGRGKIFTENYLEYSLTENTSLLNFYKEFHGIVASLNTSVTSGTFKIILGEIMNEILKDMIETLTKLKPLADSLYYENIVRNLNDFMLRIDEILSEHRDSTRLSDLCPDAVTGLSQISVVISGAQCNADITQVSNKNLIFNNSTIKKELGLLVTSIYPSGDHKARILEHLR
uniref:CULLIN_2 domain-containing protein n=1 Tax=Strongyloides venezuelensis TaxID=75913 RepID=A0A0K0F5R1_STRVS